MGFREMKATRLAAYLLKKRGGQMSYMKLIKLLYLIDRESLRQRGTPITGDDYFSMSNGPVLSSVLNLINEDPEPGHVSYWASQISEPNASREVALLNCANTDDYEESLSVAERRLADTVFNEFGHLSRWQIRDYTHTLPEWHRIESGRRAITVEDILRHVGRKDTAVDDAEENHSVDWVHSALKARS